MTRHDQARFNGIQACVFDAYGTLFDFAAAARRCQDELGADVDRLTALWRDKQLQYTWLRAAQGRHADFWQVTGDALQEMQSGRSESVCQRDVQTSRLTRYHPWLYSARRVHRGASSRDVVNCPSPSYGAED